MLCLAMLSIKPTSFKILAQCFACLATWSARLEYVIIRKIDITRLHDRLSFKMSHIRNTLTA